MIWLAYVAPVAVLFVWFLTGFPGPHERRRARELARWRDLMTPKQVQRKQEGYRATKETEVALGGPRPVTAFPGDLNRMIPEIGGSVSVARYELIEKLAYVAVMGPDLVSGSEYQAVLARLERPGPVFTVRPLPIIDGKRIPNTGVQFKKDPAFMQLFLVEGPDAKKIGKWLPRSLRAVLLELPDAWLYVDGRAMAVVLYGPVDADRMVDLITAADTIFAEHGAEGGPSLFFDEEDDDRGGDSADEDGEGEEGEEEQEREAAKPAKVPMKVAKAGEKQPAKAAAAKK